MEDRKNPLAGTLEAAARLLVADPAAVDIGAAESNLLRRLGYDDGDIAQAEGRARMLRAAARLRRLFLLPVPDAPGLTFFGGEADPATLGTSYAGLPMGNLAGSGLTSQRAFESSVGEGVEYLSQFLGDEAPVESGPLATHGRSSDTDVRRFIAEALATGSVDADRSIAWVLASRLSDGAQMRFPLDLCYRRRASEQDFTPPLKLSSGCAAGATIEAATLRALLELIERDAAALWWRGGRRGRSLAPDSEAAAAELLADIRQGKTDRETWLLDITTDVDIPVVVALSRRADGFGFAFGFGARLTLAEAARAAIFELCQVELGQHVVAAKRDESGDDALNDSDRRQLRRGTMFDTRACRLLQPETDPEAAPTGRPGVPASDLPQAIERLQARVIAAYAIDLTCPALGIPAVRVLAPALQLEPCQIVGPRLARMIERTGGGAMHHGGMPLL